MNNESKGSLLKKAMGLILLVVTFIVLFATSVLAATPYEVTKSGGAYVRKTYYESGAEVRKAAHGSIVWVKASKNNIYGNKWYQLTDGNWIFSKNVKEHSCSWSYTGGYSSTCTATGKENYRCNKCGQTKSKTVAAKGHSFSGNVCTRCGAWNTASLKSKTSLGSVKFYVTTNGSKVHSGPYGACSTTTTLNKGTEIYVTEKLVNASGNTWYRYSGGYIFGDYVIQHSSCLWTTASVTKAATCQSEGTKKQLCPICGKTKTSSIPKLGHSYSSNVCTRCGTWNTSSLKSKTSLNNDKYFVLTNGAKVHSGPYSGCKTVATLSFGDEITVTQKVVNASGNTWFKYSGGYIFTDYVTVHNTCLWGGATITKQATCQSAGSKIQRCAICNQKKTMTIPKLKHSYEKNVCKKCGTWNTASLKSKTTVNNVKYYVLTDGAKVHSGPYNGCQTVKTLKKGTDVIVTQKVVNASNNTWYKCADGYVFGDYVKKHASCSWNSGKVTKAATCKETGVKTYTCTICKKAKTATIAKTGHKYKNNVCKTCSAWKASSLKSTKTIKNVTYYVVSNGAKVRPGPYEGCRVTKTLPRGTEIKVTQQVVNAEGNKWYRYSGGYVYAKHLKEHNTCSWNGGKVIKVASCKATGSKVQTCTVCGKTRTVTIAKTGHQYKNNVCKTCGTWKTSSLKSKSTVNNLKYYAVKDNVKIRSGPYEGCKSVKTLFMGYNIVVTQKVVNASGSTWYKCSDGYIYSKNVKTYPQSKASVTLSADKMTIYVGESRQLSAVIKGPSSKITWKSSNTSVATVNSSGKITVKKAGTCTITATANGKKDSCKVTVKQLGVPKNVVLTTVSTGRQFRVTHKAVSGATGYVVSYKTFGEQKTKTYTGTTTTVTVPSGDEYLFHCTVRAYKTINGKKIYSKVSPTYTVHVHNAKANLTKKTYTKYSKADYTYHSTKVTTAFTCKGCSKKITVKTEVKKEKHAFTAAVCQRCGEKKGSGYVIGKIYPEVGDGPSYSSSEKNKKGQNPIYMAAKYTDNFFLKDSTKFDEDLCKLSAIGASASYNKTFAKDFLKECGFKSTKNITRTSSAGKNKNDHARITIGYKQITGTDKVLVGVLVNGYNTGAYEWISNFNVGEKKNTPHKGFKDAADEMTEEIFNYIEEKGFNKDNVKVWLTGHSRGSAVMGMTAVEMTAKYGVKDVFAYGFATPNGIPTSILSKKNDENIHNIVNPGDFVPYVVPSDWKFDKYGETRYLSMNATSNAAYKAMTGDKYSGLTATGRKMLIDAFSDYSPGREAYYKVKKGASPSDFGRALGLFLSEGDKGEAVELVAKCLVSVGLNIDMFDGDAIMVEGLDVNQKAVWVLAQMLYDGMITTQIKEVHTMETYVALLYAYYP